MQLLVCNGSRLGSWVRAGFLAVVFATVFLPADARILWSNAAATLLIGGSISGVANVPPELALTVNQRGEIIKVPNDKEPANVVVTFLRRYCRKQLESRSHDDLCNQAELERIIDWFCTRRTCAAPLPQRVLLEWNTSVNFRLFVEPWEHPLRKVEQFATMCHRMGVTVGRNKHAELALAFCSQIYCDAWNPVIDLFLPEVQSGDRVAYDVEWSELDRQSFMASPSLASSWLAHTNTNNTSRAEAPFSWVSGSIYINLDRRSDRRQQFEAEIRFMEMEMPLRLAATPDLIMPHRGCTMSHLRALQLAVEKHFETVLIFEDDFKFSLSVANVRRASDHMRALSENGNGFDVIMLAANLDFGPTGGIEYDGDQTCSESKRLGDNILRQMTTNNAQVASGYIVHRRFYSILINQLQWALSMASSMETVNLYIVDQVWKQFQNKDHGWWINCPRVGSGRGSKSDLVLTNLSTTSVSLLPRKEETF